MKTQVTRTYQGKIKLVVFDWAGTMVDFGCQAPIDAFVTGFRTMGVEVSMETARIPMGMEKRSHIKTVLDFPEVAGAWKKVYGRVVTDGDIDSMYDNFTSLLLRSIESKSELLPGVLDTVDTLRKNNVKIGASTGYFTEAAEIVIQCAARSGYIPDFSICSSDVPAGRPAPWLIFRTMEALNVWPPEAVVNVGDTPVDIESGLNAGGWSVGVAATGNQMGLTEKELQNLAPAEYRRRLEKARSSLFKAGAHYVIDTMDQFPAVVDSVNKCLARGERP